MNTADFPVTITPITVENSGDKAVLVLTKKPVTTQNPRECFWLMPGAKAVVFAEPEIIDPASIYEVHPAPPPANHS